MRVHTRQLPIAILLGALASGAPARAAPKATVKARAWQPCQKARLVLLSEADCCSKTVWPAAERAAASELRALGLEIRVVKARAPATLHHDELRAEAKRFSACGGLRIARQPATMGGSVAVVLMDRLTRKTILKLIRTPTGRNAATVVALRLVELLRVSLLELRMAGRSRPVVPRRLARVARSTRLVSRAPPARRWLPQRFGFRVDGVAAGSPGGIDVVGQLQLAFRADPIPQLALEITAASSLVSTEVTARGGRSAVSLVTVAGWVLWELRPRGRWRPALGVGGGILAVWALGQANEQYTARRDWSVFGYVAASAQLAVVLSRHIRLRTGVGCGLAVPRVQLVYAGHTVATYGWPSISVHLGLELRFR